MLENDAAAAADVEEEGKSSSTSLANTMVEVNRERNKWVIKGVYSKGT